MPLWLSVLLGVGCVLALAGCAFLIFSTTPAALKRQITILRAEVQECQVAVEAIAQRWAAYKTEMGALAEHMEDLAETVERKRKRVAAREAREKRDGNAQQPMSPEEVRIALTRQARGQGFEV